MKIIKNNKRIVTRPDFDGIVCAALLFEAESIDQPVLWTEPGDIQQARIPIQDGDILANLPFDDRCLLWFDHHISNQTEKPFKGAFRIAPSAARVIYEHYQEIFQHRYDRLIAEADKIDAARLTMDEVLYPEKYPLVLLSMTIINRDKEDESYWNHLVDLLRKKSIEDVMKDPEVEKRSQAIVRQNILYKEVLRKHTTISRNIAVTDLRSYDQAPFGNRFMVYALYPEAMVSIRVRCADNDRNIIIMSVGHNIFNQSCQVNIGLLLSRYNGGGHRGAGACSFDAPLYEQYINEIKEILYENEL